MKPAAGATRASAAPRSGPDDHQLRRRHERSTKSAMPSPASVLAGVAARERLQRVLDRGAVERRFAERQALHAAPVDHGLPPGELRVRAVPS